MNITQASVLLFSAFVLPLSSWAQSSSIKLFLQPDASSEQLTEVRQNDHRLRGEVPVTQAELASQGWHEADFTDTFTAYIRNADIGKDLQPVEGAEVLLRRIADSPMLTRVGADDRVNALDSGRLWEVEITTAVRVYYQLEPELPDIVVANPFDDEDGALLETGQVRLIEPPPSEVSEAASPPPPFVGRQAPDPVREDPHGPTVAEGLSRNFEGTFRRARRANLFRGSIKPYELVDSRGKRIAWVDLSKAIIPAGIGPLLDQHVIVFGPWEKEESRPEIIIYANTVRQR